MRVAPASPWSQRGASWVASLGSSPSPKSYHDYVTNDTGHGSFWPIGDREHSCAGEVVLAPGRNPTLHVEGILAGGEHLMKYASLSAIHGQWRTGRYLTLLEAQQVEFSYGPGASQRWIASYLVENARVQSNERFTTISTSTTHLHEWFHAEGIVENTEFNPETNKLEAASIDWRSVDPTVYSPDRLTFRFAPGISMRTPEGGTYQISSTTNLRITHQVGLTISQWFDEVLAPLGRMMTLLTGRRNEITQLKVQMNNSDGGEEWCPVRYWIDPTTPFEDWNGVHLLSQHDHLSDFADQWMTWLDLEKRLGGVIALFLDVVGDVRTSELEFLTVVQAVEGYDQLNHPDDRLFDPHEHKAQRRWLRRILSDRDVPSTVIRAYDSALIRANERPLSYRIDRVMTRAQQVVSRLFMVDQTMLRHITDTRNYLAHRNPSHGSTHVEHPRDLDVLAGMIRYALHANLLLDLGLRSETIVDPFVLFCKVNERRIDRQS